MRFSRFLAFFPDVVRKTLLGGESKSLGKWEYNSYEGGDEGLR